MKYAIACVEFGLYRAPVLVSRHAPCDLNSVVDQPCSARCHHQDRPGHHAQGRGPQRPTISGSDTAYARLTRLEEGQLVMSKLNAWEGALAVVPKGFADSYVSPEYPVFDIDSSEADPAYLSHLVTWPTLWNRLTPRGSMVRRKRTNPATLLSTMAPLPDLPEQRRIAARLDASLSSLAVIKEKADHSHALRGALLESLINAEQERTSTRIGDILTLERIPIDQDSDRFVTRHCPSRISRTSKSFCQIWDSSRKSPMRWMRVVELVFFPWHRAR